MVCEQDAELDMLQEKLDAELVGQGSLLLMLGVGLARPCCLDTELMLVRCFKSACG